MNRAPTIWTPGIQDSSNVVRKVGEPPTVTYRRPRPVTAYMYRLSAVSPPPPRNRTRTVSPIEYMPSTPSSASSSHDPCSHGVPSRSLDAQVVAAVRRPASSVYETVTS